MTLFLDDGDVRLYLGDALETVRELPSDSVDCVVTSPPYWGLRDYGTGEWDGGDPDCDHVASKKEHTLESSSRLGYPADGGQRRIGADNTYHEAYTTQYRDICGKCGARRVDRQMGLEPTPDLFVAGMVELFREIRRVLAPHGTCWVNLGSSYFSGQDRQPPHAPAYGNGDIAPLDSPGLDSACLGLCDEHLADYLNHHARTVGNGQSLSQDAQPLGPTGRDTEHSGSAPASLAASPLGVRESTSLRSWLQLRGACSRCDTRALSLSAVRSSTSDAPASSRSSWLNYTSRLKPKDMVPTPWMLAMALQEDGWYLRADIIWAKPNPMPESVTDRPTKAHEYVFLLTKQPRYWFDAEAVRETAERGANAYGYRGGGPKSVAAAAYVNQSGPTDNSRTNDGGRLGRPRQPRANDQEIAGRNVRSVWQIATQPYPEAHFATYPEELARRCILAGCPARVCRVCGKPSERIVERESVSRPDLPKDHPEWRPSRYDNGKAGDPQAPGPGQRFSNVETVGWSDCECRTVHQTDVTRVVMANVDKWRPGVVLDPFIGSGTTAKVARDHQRHAIGIDLNQTYLELAARRLQQLSLLNAP